MGHDSAVVCLGEKAHHLSVGVFLVQARSSSYSSPTFWRNPCRKVMKKPETGAREAYIPFSAKKPKRARVLPSVCAKFKPKRTINRDHHKACRVKNEVFQVVACCSH